MPNLLDATGLQIKTTEELLTDIEADQRSLIDPDVDVSAEEPLGQLNGIFAGHLSEALELIKEVYDSATRDNAIGVSLDHVGSLTGSRRDLATKTKVVAVATIDPGFVANPGTMFANVSGDPTIRFTNLELIENTGGVPIGVSAQWEAVDTGPIPLTIGQLSEIAEPLSGWTAINNFFDGDIGSNTDEDSEYRVRQEEELAAGGDSTVDAIRTAVANVADVDEVAVLENDSDVTDANGLPPHSIETIVRGGDDTDIAETIFETKCGGIQAFGTTTTEVVQDSLGNDHNIGITRPTSRDIYIEIDLEVFPAYAGDDAVKNSIVDFFAANNRSGVDVVVTRISALSFVAGVKDVQAVRVGFAALPVGTVNLAIDPREIADYAVIRIVVATVPATEI